MGQLYVERQLEGGKNKITTACFLEIHILDACSHRVLYHLGR